MVFMISILAFVDLSIIIQVPADGVLISGHSLAIDESSMTGESKIVSSVYFFMFYIFMISFYCE